MGRNRFLDATSVLDLPRQAVASMLDTSVPKIARAVIDAFGRPSLAGLPNLEKAKRVTMRRAELLAG